jgi:eukaryotic-like serine/threonine-protein kinase
VTGCLYVPCGNPRPGSPVGVVFVLAAPVTGQYVLVAEMRVVADRYRLVKPLGRGGFSEVWQAEDSVLGRAVAVKVFTAPAGQPDLVARFHREARTVAGLRHPNVVVVFDAGIDQDVPYVVMELLAGPSLDGLLAQRGPLPAGLALGYAEQAAAGLAAAHAAGVVHRDIKPANLVLDSGDTLKVVDFGIASLAHASASLTASGTTVGTPAYLSPEQAAGRPAEPRSDLYALGCVLYALLTGDPPFTGDHPVATAAQHLTTAAPPVEERRAGLPPVIGQLLAALLAKNPEDRPPDAATAGQWLAQAHQTLHPAAPALTIPFPVAGPERPVPHRRPGPRRWLLAGVGGAVIAVLLAALALTRPGGHPAQAGSAAPSRPPATAASSHTPAAATQRQPARHRQRRHAPVTPAAAVDTLRLAIVQAENSGAIQAPAATDLQNQLTGISQSISQGNLQDAGHKVGDLQHHLGDLTRNGQISARGLAVIQPPVSELARLLPQQS